MGSSFLGLLIRNLITDIIISYADLESVQNNLDSLGKCDEHEIGRFFTKEAREIRRKIKIYPQRSLPGGLRLLFA